MTAMASVLRRGWIVAVAVLALVGAGLSALLVRHHRDASYSSAFRSQE